AAACFTCVNNGLLAGSWYERIRSSTSIRRLLFATGTCCPVALLCQTAGVRL
ncbi:MAG: hypothetical protein AVDCRST_MAG93-8262, partial [uncultured Chloroflexia bacterium]